MSDRDHQNVLAGLFLIIVGGGAAFYTFWYLDVGTLRRMGPGMFPGAVGVITVALGLAVMIPALWRKGPKLPRPDVQATLAVLGSILVFAFLLEPFGLVIALPAMVMISAFAQPQPNLLAALVLGLALTAFLTVTFRYGFGLRIPFFSWPW